MERRGYWAALRDNPEWRRIYLARSISLLGNWLNTLAIVHLLGQGEVSAALPLAAVFVLKQIPVTFLAAAAGVIADRFDRRRIMIICDVLSAAVVCGFLVTTPGEGAFYIYALTFAQICVTSFFDPAYRAVVPDVVREEDLLTANALGAVTWSIMFGLGTAIGGVVLYAFGWQVAVVLDVITYLVSALLIASVRDARTKPPARPRKLGVTAMLGLDDLWGGLLYLRQNPDIRRLLLAKTTWGTLVGFGVLYQTLLGVRPGFRVEDSGDLGISVLWFCRAVGTGIGPPLVRAFVGHDLGKLRGAVAVGFIFGVGFYGAVSFATNIWVAGILILFAHCGGAMIWVMSTVLLQHTVPSEYRGRTFATELGSYMLTASLSMVCYGAILDQAGLALSPTLRIAVGLCGCLAILWAWSTLRRRA